MMRLFLNGLAASAGGGLTYLRNVVPHLSAREGVETTVAVNGSLKEEFGELPRISYAPLKIQAGAIGRFWWEQTALPDLLRSTQSNILISAGNFALRNSPVPQILLSRNSLYISADFYRDLRARGEYRMWLDTRVRGALAKRSLFWADRTVAPSQAFADELQRWTGVEVVAVHHGFDRDLFFHSEVPLPGEAQRRFDATEGALRVLFVSHYTYYRNFETLVRAMPALKRVLAPRKVRLILTCDFSRSREYPAQSAVRLLEKLDVAGEVVQLGSIPYQSLHHLYRACDVYVTPAYTETFAHPLVEAMASGLPIVASDLPVHREICGGAALYFSRFSPDELAERVTEVVSSSLLSKKLVDEGARRVEGFSWEKHVEQIVALAAGLSK